MKNILFNILFISMFTTCVINVSYAGYRVVGVNKNGSFQLDNDISLKIKNMYVPMGVRDEYISHIKGIEGIFDSVSFVGDEVVDIKGNIIVDDVEIKGSGLYEELLNAGYVLNYNVDYVLVDKAIIEAENNARNLQLGLWSRDKGIFLNQEELVRNSKGHVNKFKIVKGTVKSVKLVKGTMYINFGSDWKMDFTVKIKKENLVNFVDFKIDYLVNKDVIVKGWVEYYYGPAIEVYNQSHINVL